MIGARTVVDTTDALYVWEWDYYPLFYVPVADVEAGLLSRDERLADGPLGRAEVHSFAGRPGAARVVDAPGLAGCVHIDWDAVDAWFEEDERVFVHPRNPYARVDAVRSTRTVRVELGGVRLAESSSPVMVFETGLPTRYYLNRTEIDFGHLTASATVTECPYKGTTSGYWSVLVDGTVYPDLAWSYDFPSGPLLPIAGLVAFYNEKVDIFVDGRPHHRPATHFG